MTQNSTVAALVRSILRRYDSEEAIIAEDGRSISFGVLRARVHRLVHVLTDGMRMRRGDAVGVLSDNRPEYIEIDFACALAGLVKVPLYARNHAAEHIYMLDDGRVSTLICEPRFLGPLYAELGDDWGHLSGRVIALSGGVSEVPGATSYEDLLAQASDATPGGSAVLPSDIYQIRYTGGTTGRPKGATHDHAGMLVASWGNLMFHAHESPVGPRDVIAHVLPLSHASIFNVAAHSWAGARHLPLSRWDPERYLQLCERHGISISLLVPTMIHALLELEDEIARRDLTSLRTIAYGAAPISQTELLRALELLGPIFTQGYGSTEVPSLIVWLPKRDHQPDSDLIRACGYAAPWVDIEIHDDDDRPLEPGEVGEVCIKSPSTLLEYNNLPERTAEAKRNGWYHSGDLGYLDEAGYIFLQDRKQDVIISGGFNVYPAEVENAIMSHPGVVECAVVGVPDEKWGEAVSALIRLRPGAQLTAADIQDHCRSRIGSYKKPALIRFTPDPLPQSEIGKVLRREVRETLVSTPAGVE